MTQDPKPELKAAIQRLVLAMNQERVEVKVRRRDIELLLCVKGTTP